MRGLPGVPDQETQVVDPLDGEDIGTALLGFHRVPPVHSGRLVSGTSCGEVDPGHSGGQESTEQLVNLCNK
ncbi:hypothetical protein Apa02nite_069040 [Actinoplanes palleronii]|uniref:Uncharacterized protein n=1 Tax=Actinoplanes palleronii TaxID=113570 RepID=A0ABQ4BKG8_9ACTN|nr:hypothetical protein Apa02nite_069040 [Actinoplanes palleronii]